MSAIVTILTSIALKVGAPIIVNILKNKFGDTTGTLAGQVIEAVAKQAGVRVDELPEYAEKNPTELASAIVAVEEMTPELIALYSTGLQGQFSLALAEQKEGGLASAWRWGWMYLLGLMWVWALMIVPLVNSIATSNIKPPPPEILLTLTGWFISLYMGGHTLKELGKNAIDAVKSWKSSK